MASRRNRRRPSGENCLPGIERAAQSVLARKVQIANERGRWIASGEQHVLVTYHPSAILRNPDPAAQQQVFSMMTADLMQVHGI